MTALIAVTGWATGSGGGYSGGGSCDNQTPGGGGSKNNGANQVNTAGGNRGTGDARDGWVRIWCPGGTGPRADVAAAIQECEASGRFWHRGGIGEPSECIDIPAACASDRCYVGVDVELGWEDARDYCREHFNGGDLASIHNDEQNDVRLMISMRSFALGVPVN